MSAGSATPPPPAAPAPAPAPTSAPTPSARFPIVSWIRRRPVEFWVALFGWLLIAVALVTVLRVPGVLPASSEIDALRKEVESLRAAASVPTPAGEHVTLQKKTFEQGHEQSYGDGRSDGLNKAGVRVLTDEEAEKLRKEVIEKVRKRLSGDGAGTQ